MINTDSKNIEGKPIQLYDIKVDNLIKNNLSNMITYFKNNPNHMINTSTTVGYDIDTEQLKVIYDVGDVSTNTIAGKKINVIKGIDDPQEYATNFLKQYVRWLKSEYTRQNKAIVTIADTVHLVENRHKRYQLGALLFSIDDYIKWIITNLDVINGSEFENVAYMCNDPKYCLDLLLVKLQSCSKIKSSTIDEIIRTIDYFFDYRHVSFSARDHDILKQIYKIINRQNTDCIIIYDKPLNCYNTLLSYLIDNLSMKTITMPIGILGQTKISHWTFNSHIRSLTLKLYSDYDIIAIIRGYTNPTTFPTHITYDEIKEVLDRAQIHINLNNNKNLIDKRINQLSQFSEVPALAEINRILHLIVDNAENK